MIRLLSMKLGEALLLLLGDLDDVLDLDLIDRDLEDLLLPDDDLDVVVDLDDEDDLSLCSSRDVSSTSSKNLEQYGSKL
mgnify:CR=1 FL=1